MEIIIAAAILAAAYLYGKQTPAPIVGPGGVPPSSPDLVSGGYQTPPNSIGNFGATFAGVGASTGAQTGTVPPPTVLPWASPTWIGGIGGTVGSGGIPFGGVIRPGVSLGTATTVVGPSYIDSAPGATIPKLAAIRPVIA